MYQNTSVFFKSFNLNNFAAMCRVEKSKLWDSYGENIIFTHNVW